MTYSDENALHALIYKDESSAKSFVFCSSNSCNVNTLLSSRHFRSVSVREFHKNHVLHKVFNRNTVKISYACMPNIKQTIDCHKSILMKFDKPKTDECNCRKRKECPLLCQCLTKSIIYQATVTTNDNKPDQTYVGLTSNAFKTRFNNHKNSFKYRRKKHLTELSNYVWDLKDNNVDFNIKWKILKQAKP